MERCSARLFSFEEFDGEFHSLDAFCIDRVVVVERVVEDGAQVEERLGWGH